MINIQTIILPGLLLLVSLQGCSTIAVTQSAGFNLEDKQHLYDLTTWSFDGRVAVKSKIDSWSASIKWVHQPERDILKLAGPLGQGAVVVNISAAGIVIDEGNGRIDYLADLEALEQRLGMFVPLSALQYWVIGLVQPGADFEAIKDGFKQSEWMVSYPLYMTVDTELLPHKMRVYKDGVQLKLIFDQWQINAA